MSDEKHEFDLFLNILQSNFTDCYEIADIVLRYYHTELFLDGGRVQECAQSGRLFFSVLPAEELLDKAGPWDLGEIEH
jgi:hypothetical protein